MYRSGAKAVLERNVRNLVRRVALRAKAFMQADDARDFERDDFAYRWLNFVLTGLLAPAGDELRPNYTWGILHAAHLARALGVSRISAIEFGVAGGNGLLAMERAADRIEPIFGVGIDVHGFDTGAGLPEPRDYRDAPNLYTRTAYTMDVEKLRKRLTRAQLHLGLIEETMRTFMASQPAPVGFISFDVDYYSSTLDAFQLLAAPEALLLPRIHCYFDDALGFTHSDFTGERLAIAEFNRTHSSRKISQIYGLRHFVPRRHANEAWVEIMYLVHVFDHSLYGKPDGLVRRITGLSTDLKT
ncbi:MAG: hypothetical protein ACREJG_08150 [Candidatus Rokuibacteriota bacterium]